MDPTTLSVLVWGIYVLLSGFLLLVFPKATLSMFGHDTPKDHWVRVVGILALSLGYFYLVAAHYELENLYWASIYARIAGFLGFIALVVFKRAKARIILFGVFDAIGALWTLITLVL